MRYEHFLELPKLLDQKLITRRKHPTLPLWIHNYTASAQSLPIAEWPDALKDCRGLILDYHNDVIGRPFRKFWNYEQVLDQIPGDLPFTVWEKLDGSLGIVCNYDGNLVVATRGSFESEQAKWAQRWFDKVFDGPFSWVPIEGLTYLFEIIYPENRIVVDYKGYEGLKLLAVMEVDGTESIATQMADKNFDRARSFAPRHVFDPTSEEMRVQDVPGEEGYVLRWSNGFRAKVKFEEYKRLHKLITQVSTRTIWEMLRAGNRMTIDAELMLRVPEQFQQWVANTVKGLETDFQTYQDQAYLCFVSRPQTSSRAEYAAWVKSQPGNFGLLFALYDNKKIDDMIWRLIEPKWATPFKGETGE